MNIIKKTFKNLLNYRKTKIFKQKNNRLNKIKNSRIIKMLVTKKLYAFKTKVKQECAVRKIVFFLNNILIIQH